MCHPLGYAWHAHLSHAIAVGKGFSLGAFLKNPVLGYRNIIMYDQDYPPLYYIISAVSRHFFGITFMFMTSTVFLILLIYSTYKIGKMVKDEINGLLSATIVSFYPIIFLSSRDFNLEIAQAAMVCLSLYFLMRSENFKNITYSILFGVVFALGMLVKQQVLIFIIGPLLVTLINVFRYLENIRGRLINVFIAIIVFCLISFYLFYYIYLDTNVLNHFLTRVNSTSELKIDPSNWLDKNNILFYLNSLKEYQIGLFSLILLLFSIPVFYLKKEYRQSRAFFTAWVVFPLILLTSIPIKYNEYTISYLPVLAIVTSLGLLSIRNLIVKLSLLPPALIFNVFLFLNFFPSENSHYLLAHKPANNLLDGFKVYHTMASMYASYNNHIFRTSNAYYKAIIFLKGLLQNRKSKIGIVAYIEEWPGFMPNKELGLLLSLYTPYEVRNLIFDPAAKDLDTFDVIIFISARSCNGEQWLNKDYFLRQLTDFNKQQLAKIDTKNLRDAQKFTSFYFLYNGKSLIPPGPNGDLKDITPGSNGPPPPACYLVYQDQFEEVISYYLKLKLIKRIEGASPGGDILIYERL